VYVEILLLDKLFIVSMTMYLFIGYLHPVTYLLLLVLDQLWFTDIFL